MEHHPITPQGKLRKLGRKRWWFNPVGVTCVQETTASIVTIDRQTLTNAKTCQCNGPPFTKANMKTLQATGVLVLKKGPLLNKAPTKPTNGFLGHL